MGKADKKAPSARSDQQPANVAASPYSDPTNLPDNAPTTIKDWSILFEHLLFDKGKFEQRMTDKGYMQYITKTIYEKERFEDDKGFGWYITPAPTYTIDDRQLWGMINTHVESEGMINTDVKSKDHFITLNQSVYSLYRASMRTIPKVEQKTKKTSFLSRFKLPKLPF